MIHLTIYLCASLNLYYCPEIDKGYHATWEDCMQVAEDYKLSHPNETIQYRCYKIGTTES